MTMQQRHKSASCSCDPEQIGDFVHLAVANDPEVWYWQPKEEGSVSHVEVTNPHALSVQQKFKIKKI